MFRSVGRFRNWILIILFAMFFLVPAIAQDEEDYGAGAQQVFDKIDEVIEVREKLKEECLGALDPEKVVDAEELENEFLETNKEFRSIIAKSENIKAKIRECVSSDEGSKIECQAEFHDELMQLQLAEKELINKRKKIGNNMQDFNKELLTCIKKKEEAYYK